MTLSESIDGLPVKINRDACPKTIYFDSPIIVFSDCFYATKNKYNLSAHVGHTEYPCSDGIIFVYPFAHRRGHGRVTNVIPAATGIIVLDKKHSHVKEHMMAKILWADNQQTTLSEPDILKEIAKIEEQNPDTVDGHVPDESTSEFRELVGVPGPTKGSRVLYLLVFRRLRPITKLQGKDFFNVWQQCILCHFDLWQGGVFHRDIAPPNLMWRMDKYGKFIGVLNDYDLASLKSAPCPQGNERTGTLPFMALDLLTRKGQRGEVQHLYRHDLESFMWVLPWVFLRYRDGELLRLGRPLDEWATRDAETVYEKKIVFLSHFLEFRSPGMDLVIWFLVAQCLCILGQEDSRRLGMRVQRELKLKPKDGGEITEMERDDRDFLQLFMSTKGWVELNKSLSPRSVSRILCRHTILGISCCR